jgi:4-hydroxybenzoate polyprenyltransferase
MAEGRETRVRGLIDACHPLPTLAVTVVVTALAATAGRDPRGLVLVAATILTGQLSVGWSNDARDAPRDVAAARTGKPVVRGDATQHELWIAACLAAALSLPLSYLCAGPVGGSAHVLAVASAWTYNLVLKTTVLSPLPYAVSFGLVPAFVTYGLAPSSAPAGWVTAACAALGVGAHLANAIPDIDSDTAVRAGGLVATLGARRSGGASAVCVLTGLGLVLAATSLPRIATVALGLGAATACVVAARADTRSLFRLTMALAGVAVLVLLTTGTPITA